MSYLFKRKYEALPREEGGSILISRRRIYVRLLLFYYRRIRGYYVGRTITATSVAGEITVVLPTPTRENIIYWAGYWASTNA